MVQIITDTTAGLPKLISTRYHIPVIPQIINFTDQSYYEGVDLDNQTFMRLLKAAKALPKTAAPPPELFVEQFQRLVPLGETILCIHPSSDVSGTVRSAQTAALEFPTADIRVIDTRTIGSSLATLVTLAAEKAAAGETADAIVTKLNDLIPKNRIYFLVDTLEYLAKGGRIGGATALLGTVLRIKPILSLKNGRVDQFGKERTRKHALQKLIELVKSQAARNGEAYLSVMHAGVPDQAESLAQQLSEVTSFRSIPILDLPPAIVVHGGPGVLAAAFFSDGSL